LIWVVQVEVLACTVFLTWNAPLLWCPWQGYVQGTWLRGAVVIIYIYIYIYIYDRSDFQGFVGTCFHFWVITPYCGELSCHHLIDAALSTVRIGSICTINMCHFALKMDTTFLHNLCSEGHWFLHKGRIWRHV
jgi:hypothetical protein